MKSTEKATESATATNTRAVRVAEGPPGLRQAKRQRQRDTFEATDGQRSVGASQTSFLDLDKNSLTLVMKRLSNADVLNLATTGKTLRKTILGDADSAGDEQFWEERYRSLWSVPSVASTVNGVAPDTAAVPGAEKSDQLGFQTTDSAHPHSHFYNLWRAHQHYGPLSAPTTVFVDDSLSMCGGHPKTRWQHVQSCLDALIARMPPQAQRQIDFDLTLRRFSPDSMGVATDRASLQLWRETMPKNPKTDNSNLLPLLEGWLEQRQSQLAWQNRVAPDARRPARLVVLTDGEVSSNPTALQGVHKYCNTLVDAWSVQSHHTVITVIVYNGSLGPSYQPLEQLTSLNDTYPGAVFWQIFFSPNGFGAVSPAEAAAQPWKVLPTP